MSEDLLEIHSTCIRKNLTFATFRLPQESSSTTYIQSSPHTIEWKSIHDISVKKGFMMAPFDTRNGKKYILVKPDFVVNGDRIDKKTISDIQAISSNPLPVWDTQPPIETKKEEYLDQVNTIRNSISTGYFQKAVLSRIRVVEGNYIPVITQIFQAVCRQHPNAFVYLFKSNENFWLGASPESLMRLSEHTISTVSLAGTRAHTKENMNLNNWTAKEVLEQEYVTRYIHDILREFKIRDYRVTSPYVKIAGDLVHLRTDFSFNYRLISDHIWELLDELHPTPAVAGQPKDDAVKFIKQIEPHDREYYTGFLGPVESDENFNLFVNLRCMKITPGYLSLFIGGGITLESDPEEEWDETLLKIGSLLNIVQSFANHKDAHNLLQTTYR